MVASLTHSRKRVCEFQLGKKVRFNLEDSSSDDVKLPSHHINCSHMLIFNQHEGSNELIRTFLCKKADENGNLIVLDDLYFLTLVTDNLSSQQRYSNSLLHTAVCVMCDCTCGTLFPYDFVNWLATNIAYLECLSLSKVNNNSTWLSDVTSGHWSTQYIYELAELDQ